MKSKNTLKLRGLLILPFLVLSLALLPGCRVLTPLQTRVVIHTEEGRSIKYTSAKDVTYHVKSIDPETGDVQTITEFRSIASEAAFAQAERDRIQAEANVQQSVIMKEAVTALEGTLINAAK